MEKGRPQRLNGLTIEKLLAGTMHCAPSERCGVPPAFGVDFYQAEFA
jgi:hypothetical protein